MKSIAAPARSDEVTIPMRRSRSPRGQGQLLREDILRAAADLLEEGGSDQAVTLRAVARRAGIAAPSIYAHFADRDAIVVTLVREAFAALAGHLNAAASTDANPVGRLHTVCTAYLDFADTSPQRYRIMFSGAWNPTMLEEDRTVGLDGVTGTPAVSASEDDQLVVGQEAFSVVLCALIDCVHAGRSASSDPFTDATALWVGLHGLAQLRPAAPLFPWPPQLADALVNRLARIIAPRPAPSW